MLSTFGPLAERLRSGLPADLSAVVFDETGIAQAHFEGVNRRSRGERFFALPLFDNLRVARYTEYAQRFTASNNPGERAFNIQHLGMGDLGTDSGAPVATLYESDVRRWLHVFEAIRLADELLVRSYFEYTRMYSLQLPGFKMRRLLLAPSVPAFVPSAERTPSVVVWPGRRDAQSAVIALIGLEDYASDVAYVGDAPVPNVRARFVAQTDPGIAGLLAAAGCIVCTDPSDPCDAVALARRGAAVIAPTTSGAAEFVEGIVGWDAVNGSTLCAAVALACARSATGGDVDDVPLEPPRSSAVPSGTEGALVSLIVPSFDDPSDVRALLAGVAAQTYAPIEVVVVDDGSRELALAVRAFPFARLVIGSPNDAVAALRGAYAGVLGGDFELYPDHVESLVSAIARSGAAGAVARPLVRFVGGAGSGQRTTGYRAAPPGAAATRAYLVRHEAFTIDAGERSDFVRVEHVTMAIRTFDPQATPSLRLV